MEVIGYCMPPYLPSLRWLRGERGLKPKDYARTVVWSNSPGGMVLSVPVQGGASVVKRLPPEKWEISGHGDWTRIHLGALEAAYGREPFFAHCFPAVAATLEAYPPLLRDLNTRLLDVLLDSVCARDVAGELRGFRALHPRRFENIRRRLESKIDLSHSIVEPFFRLGPDAVFVCFE